MTSLSFALCDQVHGLIFVIDAANASRLDDVAKVFAEVAKEPMVVGKPILVYNSNLSNFHA
jgi:hypothetical protein